MARRRASSAAVLLTLLLVGCVARSQTVYDAEGNPVAVDTSISISPPAGSASTPAPTSTGTVTAPTGPSLPPAGGPFAAHLGEIAAAVDAGLWTDAWLSAVRLVRLLYARRAGHGDGADHGAVPQTQPGRAPPVLAPRNDTLNDTLRNARDALEELDR